MNLNIATYWTKKSLIVLIFLLLGYEYMIAQHKRLIATASSETVVINEPFQISYSLENLNGYNLKLPKDPNIEFLQNLGQSSSTTVINGQMTSSIEVSFLARARRLGKITIPAAMATNGSEEYLTNKITINVVSSNAALSQQSPNRNNSRSAAPAPSGGGYSVVMTPNGIQIQRSGSASSGPPPSTRRQPEIISEEKMDLSKLIFLRTSVDNTHPYIGQQITATTKLYSRISFQSQQTTVPKFVGFWTENVEIPDPSTHVTQEIVDGVPYNVMVISKSLLFPQQEGTLDIKGLAIQGIAQIPKKVKQRSSYDPFEDFFGGNPFANSPFGSLFEEQEMIREFYDFEMKEFKMAAPSVSVQVKPLPDQQSHPHFNQAVGQFTVSAKVKSGKITLDDIDSIILTITGRGNVSLVTDPTLTHPELDFFNKASKENITSYIPIMEGSKTITYSFTPNNTGMISIPPIQFEYFDPSTQSYKIAQSDTLHLEVLPGKFLTKEEAIHNQKPMDIAHVTEAKNTKYWIQDPKVWGAWSAPFIAFIILGIIRDRKQKLQSDTTLYKSKMANKVALKRLQRAKVYLDNNQDSKFYEEINKSLWLYISDKSKIPLSHLSKDTAQAWFDKMKISPKLQQLFFNTTENSEMQLYANSDMANQRQDTYNQALEVISLFESELKRQS